MLGTFSGRSSGMKNLEPAENQQQAEGDPAKQIILKTNAQIPAFFTQLPGSNNCWLTTAVFRWIDLSFLPAKFLSLFVVSWKMLVQIWWPILRHWQITLRWNGKQKDLLPNQRKNCRMVEVHTLKSSYLSVRKLQRLQSGILQLFAYCVVSSPMAKLVFLSFARCSGFLSFFQCPKRPFICLFNNLVLGY